MYYYREIKFLSFQGYQKCKLNSRNLPPICATPAILCLHKSGQIVVMTLAVWLRVRGRAAWRKRMSNTRRAVPQVKKVNPRGEFYAAPVPTMEHRIPAPKMRSIILWLSVEQIQMFDGFLADVLVLSPQ